MKSERKKEACSWSVVEIIFGDRESVLKKTTCVVMLEETQLLQVNRQHFSIPNTYGLSEASNELVLFNVKRWALTCSTTHAAFTASTIHASTARTPHGTQRITT